MDDNAFNLIALRTLLWKTKSSVTLFEACNGKVAIEKLIELREKHL